MKTWKIRKYVHSGSSPTATEVGQLMRKRADKVLCSIFDIPYQ